MGDNTDIGWTRRTFNPWEGCEKVSPACKFCYAESRDKRWHEGKHWGPNTPRLGHTEAYWKKPFRWNLEAEAAGRMDSVFCGSLCDILEDHPDVMEWRDRVFYELVPQTPFLRWLLLTKRLENAWVFFPDAWFDLWPTNVAVGYSAENQDYLMERDYVLESLRMDIPIFISAEPLLGPLDLDALDVKPSWVIAGGGSGADHRPTDDNWYRSLRDQCRWKGIPFFLKQRTTHGILIPFESWPADLQIQQFPPGWEVVRDEKGGAA